MQNLFYISRTNTQALRIKLSISCDLLKETAVKFAWLGGLEDTTMGRVFLADLLSQEWWPGLQPSSLSCLQSCSVQGEGISTWSLKPCLPPHHISPRTEHSLTQAGWGGDQELLQHCNSFPAPQGWCKGCCSEQTSRDGFGGSSIYELFVPGLEQMTSAQHVSVMVSSSHFTELQKLSLLGKNCFGYLGPLLNCSCWLQSIKQFWLLK